MWVFGLKGFLELWSSHEVFLHCAGHQMSLLRCWPCSILTGSYRSRTDILETGYQCGHGGTFCPSWKWESRLSFRLQICPNVLVCFRHILVILVDISLLDVWEMVLRMLAHVNVLPRMVFQNPQDRRMEGKTTGWWCSRGTCQSGFLVSLFVWGSCKKKPW